jgi:RNA polymerase-interacting CarD/CdnL/TRCF family regulator
MTFQIGDKVIHWTYGLGEIIGIEEKVITDQPVSCYVVRLADMMIWIPIDDIQQHSLRLPTPPEEFEKIYTILTSPGEKLQDDRIQRKNQLMAQMKDGQLASICQVIRDLTSLKRSAKLSDQEKSILDRAVKSLLTEWSYSQGMSFYQAQEAMADLMGK